MVSYEYQILTGCGYAYRYSGMHTGYPEYMPGMANTFGYVHQYIVGTAPYFGQTFVHDASIRLPITPPQYIDPYTLLEDERISQTAPRKN
ncbi:hypothetical protein CsSME_00047949 [Camellia sinensis var. sinensis]